MGAFCTCTSKLPTDHKGPSTATTLHTYDAPYRRIECLPLKPSGTDELHINIYGCLSKNVYKKIDSIIYLIRNHDEIIGKPNNLSIMIDIGLIKTQDNKAKITRTNIMHQLFSRLVLLTLRQCINLKYLVKILRLCNYMYIMIYDNLDILETACKFYLHIDKINATQKIFNDDIILFSDNYLNKYDKLQNNLLLAGYLRESSISVIITIPTDVQNTIFEYIFMSFRQMPYMFDRFYCLSTKYPYSTMYNIIFTDRLPKWANDCNINNCIDLQYKSLQNIRRLTDLPGNCGYFDTSVLNQKVIDSGVVKILQDFLPAVTTREHTGIQNECLFLITNLSRGIKNNAIIESDLLPLIIKLLNSKNGIIQLQSMLCLGNIAGASIPLRDLLLERGILDLVYKICANYKYYLQTGNLQPLTISSVVICKFGGKPRIGCCYIKLIFECFSHLICANDDIILRNVFCSMTYLTACVKENDLVITQMKKYKYIAKLVSSLCNNNAIELLTAPAVSAIGNIIANTQMNTEYILNCGFLTKANEILTNGNKYHRSVKKEICRTISNIIAKSSYRIQQVMEYNIFETLSNFLINNDVDNSEIANESLNTISNAVMIGTEKQIRYMVDHCRILENVCLFIDRIVNSKSMLVALECVENILAVDKENKEYCKFMNKHTFCFCPTHPTRFVRCLSWFVGKLKVVNT